MKNLLVFLIAMIFSTSVFAQSLVQDSVDGLALYTIEFKLDGMTIEGQPPGAGDRFLRFGLYLDATDPDAADATWYEHLELFLGPDQLAALQALTAEARNAMRLPQR